ncbi:MAG TPA: WXG100 family type VII secretion target [Actinospica sp.]|nr:WXG100 family type VII secretion target [Actinospica sp.]
MNINGDVVKVLEAMGLPLPGGDGDTLRAIAQDWDNLADSVDDRLRQLSRSVQAVGRDEWSGDACDAFHRHWQKQAQATTTGVQNFHTVASSLRSYAGDIDSINEELVSICEQIIIATAAGALLSIVTAGLSDIASAIADSAEAARITALIARFAELAEQVGVDIDRVAEVLGDIMENLKSLSENLKLGDLASNFVADSGANIATQALSGQKVTLGADFANGALDAGGTVAGGAALGRAGLTGAALDGAANFVGGVFQSEAGGLTGVQGDTAYELPTSGQALSTDGQNLEGALFDGLGGAMAHGAENPTATSGQLFTITDTLGNLTDGAETSGTSLKQTLASLDGADGAMPAASAQ